MLVKPDYIRVIRGRRQYWLAGADPGSVGSAISRRERRIPPIASPSADGDRRLHKSAVCARPAKHSQGDTSNEITMGTFLMGLDNVLSLGLILSLN